MSTAPSSPTEPTPAPPAAVSFGGFEFDLGERVLRCEGTEVALPPRALHTLATLLTSPGRLVTKEQLLDAVWGESFVSEGVLKEVIFLLRKTLGDDAQDPRFIQTVHRRGYRFIGDLSAVPPRRAAPPSHPVDGAPRTSDGPRMPQLAAVFFGLVGLTVASLVLVTGRKNDAPPMTARVAIEIPYPQQAIPAGLALSRDGSDLVYVAKTDARRLYLRRLAAAEPVAIGGTEGARHPFLSPAGDQVGFFAAGELRTVAVEGGAPHTLASVAEAAGAVWIDPDTIVYSGDAAGGLTAVSVGSGRRRTLSRPDPTAGETSHRWPALSPDGEAVLFTVWRSGLDSSSISALDLGSGQIVAVLPRATYARWAGSEHLVFARAGEVLWAPFDSGELRLLAPPRRLADGVDVQADSGSAAFALAADGTVAYMPGGQRDGEKALSWLSTDGTRQPTPVAPGRYVETRLSPDGRRATLTTLTPTGPAVAVADLETGSTVPLADDGGFAVWVPGADRLVYVTAEQERARLILTDRAATSARRLPAPGGLLIPRSAAADGTVLLVRPEPAGASTLWALDVDGGNPPERLPPTGAQAREARLSPDGRWIAFSQVAAGTSRIFVRRTRGGERWQVPGDGATSPMWSHDGGRLYFRRGEALLAWAFDGDGPTLAPPRPVLDELDPAATLEPVPGDRSRFLELAPAGITRPHRVELIVGWSPEAPSSQTPAAAAR